MAPQARYVDAQADGHRMSRPEHQDHLKGRSQSPNQQDRNGGRGGGGGCPAASTREGFTWFESEEWRIGRRIERRHLRIGDASTSTAPPDDADIIAVPAADPPAGVRLAHRARPATQLREVARDLAPFYQLAVRDPCSFRRMVGRVRTDPAEIAVVDINNGGGVHIPGDVDVVYGQWAGTLGQVLLFYFHSTPHSCQANPHPSSPQTSRPRSSSSRFAFNYRAHGALSCALDQTQSDDTLNLNDSTPFEHQSGCAFVPADTAGTGVWGGGGGRGARLARNANTDNGFLIASAKPGFTTDLHPVGSFSKVSLCSAAHANTHGGAGNTHIYIQTTAVGGQGAEDITSSSYASPGFVGEVFWRLASRGFFWDALAWLGATCGDWRSMSNGGMTTGNNYHLARDNPGLMNLCSSRGCMAANLDF
ncbi:hypothetical protein C8J57DRAFT_1557828 [Mycena rebaudengoi]|nr:hypothetical protein C8J57DRAFT_1557828 [Mycena rebaudengoi]